LELIFISSNVSQLALEHRRGRCVGRDYSMLYYRVCQ